DPKEVAAKTYAAATIISGQACIAIKRLYVHDSIYDAVCAELGRLAKETVVGDGLEPNTQMGPIQNKAQFERVKGFLEDARRSGTIVAGGDVLKREGYFVEPTIVRDIPDNARLVREEQFGPVLPVLRYSDIDEVIARANDTEFGLGGSVWSSDRNRVFGVATRIRASAPQTAHILRPRLIWSRAEPYDSSGTGRFTEENDGPPSPAFATTATRSVDPQVLCSAPRPAARPPAVASGARHPRHRPLRRYRPCPRLATDRKPRAGTP